MVAFGRSDLMQDHRADHRHRPNHGVSTIYIDEVGLGAGVIDRAKEIGGVQAVGINGGSRPSDTERYLNHARPDVRWSAAAVRRRRHRDTRRRRAHIATRVAHVQVHLSWASCSWRARTRSAAPGVRVRTRRMRWRWPSRRPPTRCECGFVVEHDARRSPTAEGEAPRLDRGLG